MLLLEFWNQMRIKIETFHYSHEIQVINFYLDIIILNNYIPCQCQHSLWIAIRHF